MELIRKSHSVESNGYGRGKLVMEHHSFIRANDGESTIDGASVVKELLIATFSKPGNVD